MAGRTRHRCRSSRSWCKAPRSAVKATTKLTSLSKRRGFRFGCFLISCTQPTLTSSVKHQPARRPQHRAWLVRSALLARSNLSGQGPRDAAQAPHLRPNYKSEGSRTVAGGPWHDSSGRLAPPSPRCRRSRCRSGERSPPTARRRRRRAGPKCGRRKRAQQASGYFVPRPEFAADLSGRCVSPYRILCGFLGRTGSREQSSSCRGCCVDQQRTMAALRSRPHYPAPRRGAAGAVVVDLAGRLELAQHEADRLVAHTRDGASDVGHPEGDRAM